MKIIDFILAEDVRKEFANQHSLIGVYNEKVSLGLPSDAPWPRLFKLAIYARVAKADSEIWPDRIRICILHNDKLVGAPIEGPVEVKKSESSYMQIVVNATPGVPFPSPGTLTVTLDLISNGEVVMSGKSPIPISIL